MEGTTSDAQFWKTIRCLDIRVKPPNRNKALVFDGKAYVYNANKAKSFGNTYKGFSKIPEKKIRQERTRNQS